jgi:phosphatidate cytidylyltransferase
VKTVTEWLLKPPLDAISLKTILLLLGFFAAAGAAVFGYELAKQAKDETLRRRYFSWYLIAPVVLIPAYFGGLPFAVLVGFLALMCMREFFEVSHVRESKPYKWIGRICGVALIASAFFVPQAFNVLPIFIIMLVLTLPILMQKCEGMLVKETFTIFGILYFGWFLGHLVFVRNLSGGFGYVIFLAMAVVLNDVLAYTAGRLFGKTPLAPAISPKKTVEGALGGVLGSVIAAIVFSYAVPDLGLAQTLAAALIISVAAPLGDLIISVIKRDMQVKDSGTLIPGHGGLLDRVDSLIFATPLFYYYLQLVPHL